MTVLAYGTNPHDTLSLSTPSGPTAPDARGAVVTRSTVDVARRLWAHGAGRGTSPEDAGAAAQRVCDDLRTGLSRWVGAEGYRALLDRALQLSAAEHPVLGSFSCHDGDALAAAAAARAHGAAELGAGVVALVATLTDLLGRIIGEEMAVQLVERTVSAGPRAGSRTESRGASNG